MKYNPKTCGESKKLGDIYICKLKYGICSHHDNSQCGKEKQDKFIQSIKSCFETEDKK